MGKGTTFWLVVTLLFLGGAYYALSEKEDCVMVIETGSHSGAAYCAEDDDGPI